MDLSGSSTSGAADAAGNATTSSSTSIPCRDQVYCLELAKRAVARAALHLGITNMTAEVLDTLGDVLCEYLQRLGGVLAHNVESSGRTTQHCNALDMIRAVEICTSPAVNRVHFTSSDAAAGATGNAATGNTAAAALTTNHHKSNGQYQEENGNSGTDRNRDNHNNAHPPGSWQGLAAFCFGPNWQDQKEKEIEAAELQGAGGKVGPRAVSQQEEAEKDCQEGWRAPYPDEVALFPLCSKRVANPHGMTKKGQLMNLYGRLAPPTDNPSEILRGQDLISAEDADQERQNMERILGRLPETAWGGLTPPPTARAAGSTTATTSNGAGTGTAGATTDGKDGAGAASGGTGAKRKLEEDDTAIKKEDAKAEDATGAAGDKKTETTDEKSNNSKEKDDKTGAQPAKKKVKLEDGSAKASKASTPKKKKNAAKDGEKDDEEMKDVEPDATGESKNPDDTEASAATQKAAGGQTYNYVPTFYPSIPNMAVGADAAGLRQTTVIDILEAQSSEAAASGNAASATDPNTAATFGLRSALVELGTSYWGSHADDDTSTMNTAVEGVDASKVPAGRGTAAAAPSQGPIVPLGRASGSRVSRILEGSMDAAAMQP
ncbi:expressed unknown protein [Seminavis robusta]|uniref:Bromodomain associated domain-containing protein n=1 Tax=Seminavis robusta TaxID=568900 RepID=A0A9N8D7W5_9STRA|nr:expressed unknown protein [Seminavis robusta]|eukprot:Sro24_g016680.1 n/a (604) ;mRNA; r:175441-177252